MKFNIVISTLLITFSASFAKGHFINKSDICDTKVNKSCSDNYNLVRDLQITLNTDKRLHIKLKADGKWGKKTTKAVKKFQKIHGMKKVDGWVGRSTKVALDKIARKIKFPRNKKISKRLKRARNYKNYKDFRRHTNLRRSYRVYKNSRLLRKANGRNTKLKVDISEQRVRLYVNGKVALCSPCTTGAKRKFEPNTRTYRNKRTPKGHFRIREKISNKRSTIFGDYYRGKKRVYHGDRRKFRGSKRGLRYRGASLKNWMRLTSSGIGLHASRYIKRNPGTNGCIRLPYKVARVIFKKVRRGTRVSIVN